MARILEGIFVLGCSLVGLGMSAPDRSGVREVVQLVALAQNNAASNVARLAAHISNAPERILRVRGR